MRVAHAFSLPRGFQVYTPQILGCSSTLGCSGTLGQGSGIPGLKQLSQKTKKYPKQYDGNHWKGPPESSVLQRSQVLIASGPITFMSLMDLIAKLLKREVTYYGSLFTAN